MEQSIEGEGEGEGEGEVATSCSRADTVTIVVNSPNTFRPPSTLAPQTWDGPAKPALEIAAGTTLSLAPDDVYHPCPRLNFP